MTITLDTIRECFEGAIPAMIATASEDGMPNCAYLSQVQYVDGEHVALSYQFFNKTRQNIMANPRAVLTVINPVTIAQYRLTVQYMHTETAGALFERMKAKLAGIASHTGMSGVFRLLGADVFRVEAIDEVPGETLPAPAPRRSLLAGLRQWSERAALCTDLDGLLAETLDALDQRFGIRHAMILMLDASRARLYTVASFGYPDSGVGSEIELGNGVIGVAARERTPIRIGHMNSAYSYSRAMRDSAAGSEWACALETEIPFPGLGAPRSQLAVPIMAAQQLLGALYVESEQDLRFSYDDEDALVAMCCQLGMAIHSLQCAVEGEETAGRAHATSSKPTGAALTVRYFRENDSIFLGGDYLIKGVAGSIFWTLLQDYANKSIVEFTNRELRLDSRIRLPGVSDNLEARLILLSKRLIERDAPMRIEKAGRGRFRLQVRRPVELVEAAR